MIVTETTPNLVLSVPSQPCWSPYSEATEVKTVLRTLWLLRHLIH